MRRWIGTASVIMLLLALGTHGWSETQVAQRFWLISMITGMIGIALALI